MKRVSVYILILFTTIPLTEGQDVTVTAAFDTARIFMGDQTGFTITIDQPSDISLNLPYFRDTINKKIEIINGPAIDSLITKDGRIQIIEKYLVTSFDSGRHHLNPVFAELRNENGLKRYYSNYSVLDVVRVAISPPDSASGIFDIIGPYGAPVTLGEILPWILAGILITGLLWFAIRLLKKLKKTRHEVDAPAVTDPAHIIAFRELEKLKGEELWQKGEVKRYHTRLTEILRQYLENRFSIFSLEMTTSETLEALLKTGFRKDVSYNRLKSVLNGADMVKFAKYKPEPSENELSFEQSWDFISATKKEEVVTEPGRSNEKMKEESI